MLNHQDQMLLHLYFNQLHLLTTYNMPPTRVSIVQTLLQSLVVVAVVRETLHLVEEIIKFNNNLRIESI